MKELFLSEFKKDALRELGNMCASHAANSLSEMLGGRVDVTAPELNVVRIGNLGEVVTGDEEVISVYSRIFGGISGSVIMLFTPRYGLEKVEKLSGRMMLSLADAMSRFFGVTLKPSVAVLPAGKPATILDYLRSRLGKEVEKAVFFRTSFLHQGEAVCHFFLSLNYEDINYIMKAQIPEFTEEYVNFSSMLETFEKLKGVEFRLYEVLRNARVLEEEVRSFLRNFDPEELAEETLYHRLVEILTECNIGGDISIIRTAPLEVVFEVKDCRICRITPTSRGRNTCYTTTTTLGRIFSELLGIGCEVKEVECAKNKGSACIHQVSMEQLDVFQILPLREDLVFLDRVSTESVDLISLSQDDIKTADLYAHYGIIGMDDGRVSLTDLGKIFLTFAQNKSPKGEVVPENKPPWASQ
jgi:chemotaxis protein CheY-P-specific phosphatase CheC